VHLLNLKNSSNLHIIKEHANTSPAHPPFGPKTFMVKLRSASAVGSFNETIKTAYALNWQTHLCDRAEKSQRSAQSPVWARHPKRAEFAFAA